MMMKKTQKQYGLLLTGLLLGFMLAAQTDTTMVMDPGTFEPDPQGYFLAGVTKVKDGCGTEPKAFKGCDDAYGDSDHDEVGTQFGWEYGEAIIFHGCGDGVTSDPCVGSANKYDHPEGWVDTDGDFLRLGKHKYFATDSAHFGYLITPPFTNLKSLTIKTTADISRQENTGRLIIYIVEASGDGGQTWEYIDNDEGIAWLLHELMDEGGDIAMFTDGGGNEEFQELVNFSKTADSTMLRILPIPNTAKLDRYPDGQRLNIWEVVIEAQTIPEDKEKPEVVLSVDDGLKNAPFIIQGGEFIAKKAESLFVYNFSGVLIGEGKRVGIPCKGLYIVRTADGYSKKLYIK